MSEPDTDSCPQDSNTTFMCGVCEGFYGKPWTAEQRKCLFKRMERFGMNTYLYAPKDDYKHRLYWRDLYTEEEAADLQDLIVAAKNCAMTFVYAISPGLDITYSSPDELKILGDKLSQVKGLGCQAFAMLFDDIDTDLCEEDEQRFRSVSAAQCYVTNQTYETLLCPSVFLFCPTEYCDTRATPDLLTSEYLLTLGSDLHKDISILWTGPMVVPRLITVDSIRELKRTIKRSPVIWDNLHANDYDQTRLYLGAYDGRPPELISELKGVLTNPNCEHELNFVALHTLAQWQRNCVQHFPLNIPETDVEMEDISEGDRYNAKLALIRAVSDWLPEFYKTTGTAPPTQNKQDVPGSEVSMEISKAEDKESSVSMETIDSNKDKSEMLPDDSSTTTVDMDAMATAANEKKKKKMMDDMEPLRVTDLLMLCDLFSLPYEHGPRATHLLKRAHWLIEHTEDIKDSQKLSKLEQTPAAQQWYERALQFHDCYRDLALLTDKIVNIPNRDLLYELHSYLSDMRSVVGLVNSYIKWFGMGKPPKEPFRSGEHEPWMNRGGLHSEFRRLLPIEGKNDLCPRLSNLSVGNQVFTIRPYLPSDKEALYRVCKMSWGDTLDCSDLFSTHHDFIADKMIGGLLDCSTDLCYVLLDDASVCGYIAATSSVSQLRTHLDETWMPRMKKKYPRTLKKNTETPPAEKVIETFLEELKSVPDDVVKTHPAYLQLSVLCGRVQGASTPCQLLTCVLTLLKSRGVTGVHTVIHPSHLHLLTLHLKLGFQDVTKKFPFSSELLLLAKSI